ncbi:MAG: PH domain-containing protein [Streptosporangiaceae bacterium]
MIEASSGTMSKITVILTDDAVLIRHGLGGRNERRIPLSGIGEITFWTALTGRGYLEIRVGGATTRIPFTPWKKGEFRALKLALDEKLSQR